MIHLPVHWIRALCSTANEITGTHCEVPCVKPTIHDVQMAPNGKATYHDASTTNRFSAAHRLLDWITLYFFFLQFRQLSSQATRQQTTRHPGRHATRQQGPPDIIFSASFVLHRILVFDGLDSFVVFLPVSAFLFPFSIVLPS